MDFLNQYIGALKESIESKKQQLAKGSGISDFAEYKRVVGQYEGLIEALGRLDKFLEQEAGER